MSANIEHPQPRQLSSTNTLSECRHLPFFLPPFLPSCVPLSTLAACTSWLMRAWAWRAPGPAAACGTQLPHVCPAPLAHWTDPAGPHPLQPPTPHPVTRQPAAGPPAPSQPAGCVQVRHEETAEGQCVPVWEPTAPAIISSCGMVWRMPAVCCRHVLRAPHSTAVKLYSCSHST